MRSVYSSSARAVYLDREQAVRALRGLASRLVAADPTVRAVVLFGSLARGGGVPGSDADLLVALESSPRPLRRDRIPDLLARLSGAPVPLDVHPYTVAELVRALRDRDALASTAVAGVVLAGVLPSGSAPSAGT